MTEEISGKDVRKRDIQVPDPNLDAIHLVERLRSAIKSAGGNKHVSALSGVPNGSINHYLTGRSMSAEAASRIARACGVSLDWLLLGDEVSHARSEVSICGLEPSDDLTHIDYYNVAASAGFGLCADEAEKPEKVAISKRFLRQDLGLEPNRAIMLETRGDSMEPALRAGDLLVVDTRQQHILDGVHVLVVNGGLLVKRVSAEPDGKVRIASDNPLYPPFFTDISRVRWGKPDGDNTITVIGRVAYRLQAMS
ncbi:S24 family peptidase [Komagataeibacter xylinus]|uniref:LexA family transcriptional regulator n=1 Tax=Komagataeibacter xylinus TaxID=28448 RepID=UPI00280B916C|nr:S24 family peptidase [Komagataeibacter xylinus]